MHSHTRSSSVIMIVLSLLISVGVWIFFAPTQLGGNVTYVIVDGNSMEPKFHFEDLLLIRKQPTYRVGDAVAYQNAEIGRIVFHRIIGLESDRFILKGDNNSWLDNYHPRQEEIMGKLSVHLPKLGRAVEWARMPFHMALVVGLFGGILMASMMLKQPRRERTAGTSSGNFRGVLEGIFYLIGFFVLLFLGLGVFAFTRPPTRTVGDIRYQQEGYFFYSATGTPGVYDTDVVRAGEPVFPKLTCFMNVGFNYSLAGQQLAGTSGVHQMYARVLDQQSGWQRTIPLVPETGFGGNSYLTMATVDLCQVEELVQMVEQETGLHANTYTLEIVSHVAITSNAANVRINDTFDPSMVFRFDEVHFFLASGGEGEGSLSSSKEGSVNNPEVQVNILPLLGWNPTVQTVRGIALAGLGLSFGALLIVGWYVLHQTKQNQEALIRLKYGGLLMDVYERNIEPTHQIIDVASIDDLARLAERQNTMILHMRLNFLHYYLIQIGGITYRYLVSTGRKGIAEPEPVQPEISEYLFNRHEHSYAQSRPSREEISGYVVNSYPPESSQPNGDDTRMLRKIKL